MIDVKKIHNTLSDLKQESFELLYHEIKEKYGSIFDIKDFLLYFTDKIGGNYEYSLYADFINYYFEKEDEQ